MTSTIEMHIKVLKKVFELLSRYNFKTNPSKCQLLMTETKYVGFHISQDGIVPDAERTARIDLLNVPQDVTQLQSFLGSVQFYRQHKYSN